MYYFELDETSSLEMDLHVSKRPSFPFPTKNINEYDVPGRDGKLYEDLQTYDDIVINVDVNYICDPTLWHYKFRNAKEWLIKKGIRKLTFSDNSEFYFIVKKIDISENERRVRESGEFTISFTCEAYSYMIAGNQEYDAEDVLYNDCKQTCPKYIIKGEGVCHLVINSHDCLCNVGQNLIIDTYLEICYRENGELQNTSINADYKDLRLIHGQNQISITEGFSLKVIPNWRCL